MLLAWTVFTLVMYSFPAVMPVKAGNMNYVCVVYFVVSAIVAAYWYAVGRWEYKGAEVKRDSVTEEAGGSVER